MSFPVDPSTSTDAAPERVWGKALRGGAWLFGLRLAERGLGLVRIVVLARLLTPEDFGLMGIALVAMALMRQFSETGFRQALIQRRGEIRGYLGTAWTVNLLRGLILALIMVAAAPYVARFFDAPAARPILQVLAISWVISALRNIGLVYLHKELAFRRFFAYRLALMAAEMAVSITAAVLLRSVWALVLGLLVSNIVGLVLSYVVAPWPERIRFDLRQAREMFQFGRWIFGMQMLTFLLNQLSKIVVGRVMGVASLGLFQMASNISFLTNQQLTGVISQATFPAYAKIQHSIQQVRDVYLKTVQIASLISLPVAAGTIVLAGGLTRHVLGEQWLPIVGTLQILVIWGLMATFSHIATSLLDGMGRPDLPTKAHAARLAILAALIYPFVRWWGMQGAAIAVVVSNAAIDPVVWLLALRLTGARVWDLLRALAPAVSGSALMALSLILIGQTVLSPGSLTRFAALTLFGGATYLTALGLCVVIFRWNPKSLLVPRESMDGQVDAGSPGVGEEGVPA